MIMLSPEYLERTQANDHRMVDEAEELAGPGIAIEFLAKPNRKFFFAIELGLELGLARQAEADEAVP